jgi:hypothetical protein
MGRFLGKRTWFVNLKEVVQQLRLLQAGVLSRQDLVIGL